MQAIRFLITVLLGTLALARGPDARAYSIRLPAITGAQVVAVWPNSPAQRIGLEVGDVIVGIDNLPVRSLDEYRRLLGPGSRRVELLIRDGRTGLYVRTLGYTVNGRLGVNLAMTVVPEPVISDWSWRRSLR